MSNQTVTPGSMAPATPTTSAAVQSALDALKAAHAAQVQSVLDQANAMKAASDAQFAMLVQEYSAKEAAMAAEQEAWRATANEQIDALTKRAVAAEAALNAAQAAPPAPPPAPDPLADPAIRAALLAIAQQRIAASSPTAAATDTQASPASSAPTPAA